MLYNEMRLRKPPNTKRQREEYGISYRIPLQPNGMRYSMDAFGPDLTAITKDVLGIDILWCRESLPKYFTLIHALLAEQPMPEPLWESAGLSSRRRRTANGRI